MGVDKRIRRPFDTVPGRTAREWFAFLRPRLLSSRPIIGDKKPRPGADGIKTPLEPIYGAPTFRNVISDGKHI